MNKPEIVARALGYPYDIRDSSFTLHNGNTVAFDPAATADRDPVIAVGSNRAPQQLKRKFGDTIRSRSKRLQLREPIIKALVYNIHR